MKKHNPENERIKRRYFDYLKDAKGQSEQTVDAAAKALARFEEYTKWRDFKAFHHQQAIAFKADLAGQRAQLSGEKLSKATLHACLSNLKRFFQWLSDKPGYKSRFQYSDADYFSLSDKDLRIATAKRGQKAPTLEQVKHVITVMPNTTELERRNRALIAFTLLTGARDGAIASLKLGHVNMQSRNVYQDARDVRTKFSKSFTSFFFPVGDEVCSIVADWVLFLKNIKHWGNDDPLFPATQVLFGEHSRQFEATGIGRTGWKSAGPIRTIFKEAFQNAGLPYFSPHTIRNTLVRFGQSVCQSPEQFKAWSQNLGHEQVLTTFFSYGEVSETRQGEIIQNLRMPTNHTSLAPDVLALLNELSRKFIGS